MADIITVNWKTGAFKKRLARINRLPITDSNVGLRWGKMYERALKESARQARISQFKGKLYGKGIEWRQRPRGNIGRLFMKMYGVYLDSMRPHWVNIEDRRTTLLSWAEQARDPFIRNTASLINTGVIRKKAIYVRPHPFVMRAWKRTRPKLNAMRKQNAQRTIHGG